MPGFVPKNGRWSAETSIGPPHDALDARGVEPRQQPAQPGLRALGRRAVAAEALVDPAAEADRPGAAPHQHAAVVQRAEIVDEHAAVDDRLPAGPVDLLEQLRDGLGEHDVRAEVREAARGGPPARERGVRREHDLGRTQSPVRRRDLAVAHAQRRRLLVDRHACSEHVASQRAHEQPGMHGRSVAEVDAGPKDGRADALRQLVRRQRDGFLRMADARGRFDGALDRAVLRGRGRDVESPTLAQPDVVTECSHGRHDPLARAAKTKRILLAEHGQDGRERRPVAVAEAAVPPARPGAADLGLDERDTQIRVAFAQGQRRPQAGVAAADDGDVGGRVA